MKSAAVLKPVSRLGLFVPVPALWCLISAGAIGQDGGGADTGTDTDTDTGAEALAGAEPEAGVVVPEVDLALRAYPVATVNGEVLTWGEVARRFRQRSGDEFARMPDHRLASIIAQMGGSLIDDVINDKLLAQAAEKEGIRVSPGEVDEALAKLAASLPEGETIDNLTARVGVGQAELRRDFEESIKVGRLVESSVGGYREPSEAEIARFYETNKGFFYKPDMIRARHILIAFAEGDDDAAKAAKREFTESVRGRLVGPGAEDFAAVAREVSDDASAVDGGDLGWFGPKQMVPEFEAAALAQRAGEIGPVVETGFGYHIIRVEESEVGEVHGLEEVRPMIVEHIRGEQEREAANELISKLRRDAKIEKTEMNTL